MRILPTKKYHDSKRNQKKHPRRVYTGFRMWFLWYGNGSGGWPMIQYAIETIVENILDIRADDLYNVDLLNSESEKLRLSLLEASDHLAELSENFRI